MGKEIFSDQDILNYYICRMGRLEDYIDIDAVLDAYKQLGYIPQSTEEQVFREYCHISISEFSQGAPFTYLEPDTRAQCMAVGLLLGYPLEATWSFMFSN